MSQRSPRETFARHYVNPAADDAADAIAARMRETGLVTVDGLTSRRAVLDLAAKCMQLIPHRDSEPHGLTVIQDSGHPSQPSGFAGFSNQALPVHTERSGTPEPPRLMLFVCARPAEVGGAIRLADGRAVHTDLAHQRPDAATALADPRARQHMTRRHRRALRVVDPEVCPMHATGTTRLRHHHRRLLPPDAKPVQRLARADIWLARCCR
ncbi:TauD/TfdA family dioxygenase [Streptomyces sp. DSM 44917]|uniref:TauD/TfdA family dioxygenase n=1 Tax=Streptomyces boetiae TaxID=3075541 RepID=A0ABU2L7M9_9ACTN|nr:TauD/TfdA family dioxygenase [Streptomyces sp. DSM 44917]MDT0307303.1 TauD/TfdA family dioxygenase [Streptomyces sp. DSM 44917]